MSPKSASRDTQNCAFIAIIEAALRGNPTTLPKKDYLSILNEFSRLCRSKRRDELLQNISDDLNRPITLDDIFKSLKTALFNEAAEVRAASLRAIRILLKDVHAVETLLRCNLPIFIVRSIDIVLENRQERIQALRLVRKFLSISPHLFPPAFTRSLIAIAQDGQVEHDILTRACWAILAELSIISPRSATRDTQNCAFNAIMDAALTGNQPHGMCESLISTLLYMLNWPQYRCLIRGDLDLQIFVAPFTDSHYTAPVAKDQKQRINQAAKFDVDPHDQRENKFTAAKITLISILRSWQGLIYLCEPQSSECNLVSNSCLKSLINMLYLPYNDVRRRLIDLIFELLYLPLPDTLSDFETGLKFLDKHQLSMDSWKIHDAFVVDEAKAILPASRSRPRMDLVNNYLALLLITLFHCDVVDALSEVIITPSNQENSIRATILLYQLLSLSYRYLPTESFSRYLTLSTLISHATSKVDDSRDLANAALINLDRVHPLKKSSNCPSSRGSIFLGQILEFCSPQTVNSINFPPNHANNNCDISNNSGCSNARNLSASCAISTTSTITNISAVSTSGSNPSPTSTIVGVQRTSRSASITSRPGSLLSRSPSMSAATMQLKTLFTFPSTVKSSIKSILENDWQQWDWEQINFMLTRPNDSMKKLSSQHYKAFIRRLVHFFKPSSNQYSEIDINNERCRQLCETGCNMVDFLVESPEPKATELLKELLHDISISMHDPDSVNNHLGQNNIGPNSHYGQNRGNGVSGTIGGHHTIIPHFDINILSSSKLISTMSSTYFLFIGRLSNTQRGYRMLEKSSIMKLINNLTQASMLTTSPAEVYVRLIITCLDYTKDFNGSRQLLEKFLFNHPEENVRIYATNFLRVLLRANVTDFSTWAIELLVRQLDSPIRVVQNAAADILDEACDLDDHLEGLINLKKVIDSKGQPKNVMDMLRASGDPGILLLCRYASSTSGLKYLLETPKEHQSTPLDSVLGPSMSPQHQQASSNHTRNRMNHIGAKMEDKLLETIGEDMVDNGSRVFASDEASSLISNVIQVESEFDVELTRWQKVYNYRYVKLVEDVLNNTLTYHQKGEDGKYGRRIDRINLLTKNSHIPPHLYGQLALHLDGVDILQTRKLLEPHYEMIRNPPNDLDYSEVSTLKFKAALWIIGNVGSSESGYQIFDNSRELVKSIAQVAQNASVLSLRGTAFYVMGLLGATEEGAEEMKMHRWIVRQGNMVALPLDLGLILTKPQEDLDSTLAPDSEREDYVPSAIDESEVHPILRENYSMIQLEQIRKDILKHVTNLSHSVASRPAENSLLNLKRKYGVVFQHDLGLYYEVCQQLAKYNFRLHARRFLQELFLDIT
uniref:Rapamycin-insensitive companion of mTOR n=1 Tax=Aceria tosichella TaxID=561515 RepID=A0A6G1S4P4_9ACAR